MTLTLLFTAGLFLAYANGANDNFKGVATLLGSGTAGPRQALVWATATTLAGSFCAVLLSGRLIRAFSGRGIVPDELVGDAGLLLAVGLGAAVTVMVATLRGLPVSTTHALVGGLAGGGLAAAGADAIAWPTLARAFALPLLLSPLVAATAVFLGERALRPLRRVRGPASDTCACLGIEPVPAAAPADRRLFAATAVPALTARIDHTESCSRRYQAGRLALTPERLVEAAHWLSAGAVSFARGLNDTPKIAAVLMAGGTLAGPSMATVGAGMATGAAFHALRVGHTMSWRISPMVPGQGLQANLATALLVTVASRLGMPVSTTHVSVGSLFGLGVATGGLVHSTARRILLAWVVTVPLAGLAAGGAYALLA